MALGLANSMGSIEAGKAADLVVLDGVVKEGLRNFGAQSHENVIAVLIDGRLTATDARKFTGAAVPSICPHTLGSKRLCVDFSRYNFTFDEMKTKNAGNVDVFSLDKQSSCRVP